MFYSVYLYPVAGRNCCVSSTAAPPPSTTVSNTLTDVCSSANLEPPDYLQNPDLPTYHNNQLKIRLTTQVLCSLKATATHIYWQELLTDKKYTIRQWPAGHNGFLLCCCPVQFVKLSAIVAALLCYAAMLRLIARIWWTKYTNAPRILWFIS